MNFVRYDYILEAILTSTQPGEKLWCVYKNLMSNTDFRIKTTVLKKIWILNWSFTPNDLTEEIHFKGVTCSPMQNTF